MTRKYKFETAEQVLATFSLNERSLATQVFNYACELPDTSYYISDGIMFKRATRKYKFLSISTKGNRVLFHVPITIRDAICKKYQDEMKIYIPTDLRDKNQIDIEIKDIDSIEKIKGLINLAYKERE
ncbi:hypothetical protein ACFWGC_29305 [Cytobacillus pseudoceanisediminis]|uniref:hypothetical protein n=1 Tax=Bacillaceae TaxID=186817 RepID=UPI001A8DAA8F|nr:hypothetical protein [Bacillus sp. NTK034]MBN8199185.1 hypothetical protein [Bacillus sp. NTK034]